MTDTEGWEADARQRFAKEDGAQIHRTRRSPARLPAGTWPRRKELGKDGRPTGALVGCMPVSEVLPLLKEELGAIELLELEAFRPLRYGIEFGAAREEDRRILHAVFPLRFGCSLETALWLVPYMTELEFGRAERFELERCAADPGSVELLTLARSVLQRTRLALARSTTYRPMLPNWLSAKLTALLLKRFSYTRGGGPHKSLSIDAIRKLLVNSEALARYLRTAPSTSKQFLSELAELDRLIAVEHQRKHTARAKDGRVAAELRNTAGRGMSAKQRKSAQKRDVAHLPNVEPRVARRSGFVWCSDPAPENTPKAASFAPDEFSVLDDGYWCVRVTGI